MRPIWLVDWLPSNHIQPIRLVSCPSSLPYSPLSIPFFLYSYCMTKIFCPFQYSGYSMNFGQDLLDFTHSKCYRYCMTKKFCPFRYSEYIIKIGHNIVSYTQFSFSYFLGWQCFNTKFVCLIKIAQCYRKQAKVELSILH